MAIKIGFELEKFIGKDGSVCVCPPDIPHDDCGWLVEYRSRAYHNFFEAAGSLIAEEQRVKNIVYSKGFQIFPHNYMKISPKIKLEARRLYNKGVINFKNLYDKFPSTLDHAGLHISFTNSREIIYRDNGITVFSQIVNEMWDFVSLFKKLDRKYSEEIKKSKRVAGFYELKQGGRIEYRSLPNDINIWELVEFLENELK